MVSPRRVAFWLVFSFLSVLALASLTCSRTRCWWYWKNYSKLRYQSRYYEEKILEMGERAIPHLCRVVVGGSDLDPAMAAYMMSRIHSEESVSALLQIVRRPIHFRRKLICINALSSFASRNEALKIPRSAVPVLMQEYKRGPEAIRAEVLYCARALEKPLDLWPALEDTLRRAYVERKNVSKKMRRTAVFQSQDILPREVACALTLKVLEFEDDASTRDRFIMGLRDCGLDLPGAAAARERVLGQIPGALAESGEKRGGEPGRGTPPLDKRKVAELVERFKQLDTLLGYIDKERVNW